ncbi:MAG: DUF4332 domain-containing protein [Theionarchaea archaeon]|nr:DUF4332 domain-containing protein [Theionarchaea archaeon]
MDEEGFAMFLKKGGRSPSVQKRVINFVRMFEQYLKDNRNTLLDDASPEDLEAFVEEVEKDKKSAKTHLWAIRYYYQYTANEGLAALTGALREQRITRKPFLLKDFRGVNTEQAEKLAAVGIRNVNQMLKKGKTEKDRQTLSQRSGIPQEGILELVKLSDLARIPGVKSIRARLYYDAGVDTVEKLAEWDPEELRRMLIEFVEKTGFEGIAPLPAEALFTVKTAKRLPKVVEY